jgi:hypothetical protein
MPPKWLEVKMPDTQITPLQNVRINVPVPLERCDTSAVHLYAKIDTIWYNAPHVVRQLSTRQYEVMADWKPNTEYSLEIDSAAFKSIYGLENNALKQGVKVGNPDDFSTLVVEISGAPVTASDTAAVVIVRLLDNSGKLLREEKAKGGKVEFQYVKPATYYLSAFCDMNGNGVWDTGVYDEDRQAEPVFYFTEEIECKAKWDVSRRWNLTATARYKQKPSKIIKQKPEQAKKLKNRNLDRAKQLGKEYIQEKTGMRL